MILCVQEIRDSRASGTRPGDAPNIARTYLTSCHGAAGYPLDRTQRAAGGTNLGESIPQGTESRERGYNMARWSTASLRQEKLDRQAATLGSVDPRGIPVTGLTPRTRGLMKGTPNREHVTPETPQGVQGTVTQYGDSKGIELPQTVLTSDYSVRLGILLPSGERLMSVETIGERQAKRDAQTEATRLDMHPNVRMTRADKDAATLKRFGNEGMADTWNNRQDS